MNVRLDNGRKSVDLEYNDGIESFLELVMKALEALHYREDDVRRFLNERHLTQEL